MAAISAGAPSPVSWLTSDRPVAYPDAVAGMERRAAAVCAGTAPETVWLLEHPPLYTAGTSARAGDLLDPARFPVFRTGRGGQYTYHGPGQRVAYVMLDLDRRGRDLRLFVTMLEHWVATALARFGVRAEPRSDRVGLWVARGDGGEDKIAAIGVRVRRWVTYHGVAVNLAPDLDHYAGIVPCGLSPARYGVTSLAALGIHTTTGEFDAALAEAFDAVFGERAAGGRAPTTTRA